MPPRSCHAEPWTPPLSFWAPPGTRAWAPHQMPPFLTWVQPHLCEHTPLCTAPFLPCSDGFSFNILPTPATRFLLTRVLRHYDRRGSQGPCQRMGWLAHQPGQRPALSNPIAHLVKSGSKAQAAFAWSWVTGQGTKQTLHSQYRPSRLLGKKRVSLCDSKSGVSVRVAAVTENHRLGT